MYPVSNSHFHHAPMQHQTASNNHNTTTSAYGSNGQFPATQPQSFHHHRTAPNNNSSYVGSSRVDVPAQNYPHKLPISQWPQKDLQTSVEQSYADTFGCNPKPFIFDADQPRTTSNCNRNSSTANRKIIMQQNGMQANYDYALNQPMPRNSNQTSNATYYACPSIKQSSTCNPNEAAKMSPFAIVPSNPKSNMFAQSTAGGNMQPPQTYSNNHQVVPSRPMQHVYPHGSGANYVPNKPVSAVASIPPKTNSNTNDKSQASSVGNQSNVTNWQSRSMPHNQTSNVASNPDYPTNKRLSTQIYTNQQMQSAPVNVPDQQNSSRPMQNAYSYEYPSYAPNKTCFNPDGTVQLNQSKSTHNNVNSQTSNAVANSSFVGNIFNKVKYAQIQQMPHKSNQTTNVASTYCPTNKSSSSVSKSTAHIIQPEAYSYVHSPIVIPNDTISYVYPNGHTTSVSVPNYFWNEPNGSTVILSPAVRTAANDKSQASVATSPFIGNQSNKVIHASNQPKIDNELNEENINNSKVQKLFRELKTKPDKLENRLMSLNKSHPHLMAHFGTVLYKSKTVTFAESVQPNSTLPQQQQYANNQTPLDEKPENDEGDVLKQIQSIQLDLNKSQKAIEKLLHKLSLD